MWFVWVNSQNDATIHQWGMIFSYFYFFSLSLYLYTNLVKGNTFVSNPFEFPFEKRQRRCRRIIARSEFFLLIKIFALPQKWKYSSNLWMHSFLRSTVLFIIIYLAYLALGDFIFGGLYRMGCFLFKMAFTPGRLSIADIYQRKGQQTFYTMYYCKANIVHTMYDR